MCRQSATVCLVKSPTRQHRAIGPLAERLRALAGLRCRRGKRHPFPPSGATICRVVKDTCPGGLADPLGHGPAGCDALAVDSKSACGSRLGATPAAHLLAAMTGTGMTVTRLRVPEKTNEITCFADLLDPYDLQGVTVTGDALHTQR